MNLFLDAKVAQNGRLVLPKPVREALGMPEGGTVVFSLEDGQVKLTSIQQSVKKAQALYRRYTKADYSTDDFIAERRAETAREDES